MIHLTNETSKIRLWFIESFWHFPLAIHKISQTIVCQTCKPDKLMSFRFQLYCKISKNISTISLPEIQGKNLFSFLPLSQSHLCKTGETCMLCIWMFSIQSRFSSRHQMVCILQWCTFCKPVHVFNWHNTFTQISACIIKQM